MNRPDEYAARIKQAQNSAPSEPAKKLDNARAVFLASKRKFLHQFKDVDEVLQLVFAGQLKLVQLPFAPTNVQLPFVALV